MKRDKSQEVKKHWEAFLKTRGADYRKLLLEDYRDLVRYAAKRLHSKLPDKVDLDDLVSAGIFGLMDAIESYDPSRGVKFETFCSPRIKAAILDELRSMDWIPRLIWTQEEKLRGRLPSEQMLEICLIFKESSFEAVDAEEVAEKFLQLYKVLNKYHVSGGGNGLIIDDWQTLISDAVPQEVLR